MTFAVVGLGNPGRNYTNTRHNAGFATVDKLAEKLNVEINKLKFKSLYAETFIGKEKVLIVKPQTYMNESGQAVREICNFYKIEPENLIVVVDDIDIEFAELRIRKKGSAGTHNGLKSIIYQIQSDDFPRIKIGVGKKHEKQDLADFVLSKFSKEELQEIEAVEDSACDAIIFAIEKDIDNAMNKFNRKKI